MQFRVTTLVESAPSVAWARHVDVFRQGYLTWFLSEGEARRPTYLATHRALRAHMPELLPLYDQLVELADGSDRVARLLGLYCPAPIMAGCSQAVWLRDRPMLVRNYDYGPALWEKTVASTQWLGRRVMGMSDCLWGLLDGVNEDGLSLSLAFGGSRAVGIGFGISLIMRYVLQVCTTAAEAAAVLKRVPCHMAYSVTALDKSGHYETVFMGPGRAPASVRRPVITNHQRSVEWAAHADATGSVDRLRVLSMHLQSPEETSDRFIARFLEPPTYSRQHRRGFGTLYTAVYRPDVASVTYLWPGYRWDRSVHDTDSKTVQVHVESDPLKPA